MGRQSQQMDLIAAASELIEQPAWGVQLSGVASVVDDEEDVGEPAARI